VLLLNSASRYENRMISGSIPGSISGISIGAGDLKTAASQSSGIDNRRNGAACWMARVYSDERSLAMISTPECSASPCKRMGRAVGQEVHGLFPLQIDEYGPVAPAFAKRPIINAEDPW